MNRRKFFTGLGLAGTGSLLPPIEEHPSELVRIDQPYFDQDGREQLPLYSTWRLSALAVATLVKENGQVVGKLQEIQINCYRKVERLKFKGEVVYRYGPRIYQGVLTPSTFSPWSWNSTLQHEVLHLEVKALATKKLERPDFQMRNLRIESSDLIKYMVFEAEGVGLNSLSAYWQYNQYVDIDGPRF
jgi:hypothetical protein